MDAGAGLWPVPEGTLVEEVDAGGVACEWVSGPAVATDRAILYLHGGAYTTGSLATHRRHVAQLSAAAGARVLNVEYRLAPEKALQHSRRVAISALCCGIENSGNIARSGARNIIRSVLAAFKKLQILSQHGGPGIGMATRVTLAR